MKKTILLVIIFFVFTNLHAEYFKFIPVEVTQPDKSVLHCFSSGDELYHAMHDKDGYTIVQSETDGYFYYAELIDNKLITSLFRADSTNPISVGLQPWLRVKPTATEQKAIVEQYSRSMSKVKAAENALTTGLLSNVIIYVRFKGEAEFTKTRQGFEDMMQSNTTTSLNSYYNEISYGQLNVQSTHFPICDPTVSLSYEDINERNFYSPYNAVTNANGYTADNSKDREHSLVQRVVNAMSSQIPSSLIVDANNDGYVDNLTVVVRGNADGWGKLLWPHAWSLYTKTAFINSKRVDRYIFITENMYTVKTMCHEAGHIVGAPDYYHYTDNGMDPVGNWDLMQSGMGHMLAFTKWKYTGQKWIKSIPEITASGDYTLKPITSNTNNCYKIKSPYSNTEYIVVEFRKKTGMYESNIPQSGLIFSRINTLASGNGNGPPDEVYVYRPQGSVFSNGSLSSAAFANLYNKTNFNGATNPRAFLSDGSDAGIDISNIQYKTDSMTFHVNIVDEPIDKSIWRVTADSYEAISAYHPPTNVIDNKTNTIWHTPWGSNLVQPPHWLSVDFGKMLNIKGFKYLPRQDMVNGRIKDYEFYSSDDAVKWNLETSGTFSNTALLQIVTFPERRCKYVKLVALNEVTDKPLTSVAELDFVYNTSSIPRNKWGLLGVSSFESGKNGELAFDSIESTYWTSKTTVPASLYPHELAINLNSTYCVESLSYLPRQDNTSGTIAKYELYSSMDANNWELLKSGEFDKNSAEKMIAFPKKICRYVKLIALSEMSLRTMASVAEINLYGTISNDSIAPSSPLNFRITNRVADNITLTWDKNVTDNSVLYYQLQTSNATIAKIYNNQVTVQIDATQNNSFTLQAIDGSGNVSPESHLNFDAITSIENINTNAPNLYTVDNKLVISNLYGENKIKVYDSLGQLIINDNCSAPNYETLILNHIGILIVSIEKENQIIVRKKVIVN